MRKALLGLLVITVLSIHSGSVKVDAADNRICYTSSGDNSTYIPAEPKPDGGEPDGGETDKREPKPGGGETGKKEPKPGGRATIGRGPKTGDMTRLMPWVIAAAGALGLLVVIWKKRGEEEETEEVTYL